jgi:hypothetical protein
MKPFVPFALLVIGPFASAIWAQQTPVTFNRFDETKATAGFAFRVLVQPGTEIDHYPFPKRTSVESTALNEKGDDYAFIARWELNDGGYFCGIFTSRRAVATEGDGIDGKVIVSIPKNAPIAIDDEGHVAFEAEYANDEIELMGNIRRRGIFIDQHLALVLSETAINTEITLTNSGFVVPWHFVFGFGERPFHSFRRNDKGQFLIPINIDRQGFLLLLATPN